MAGVVVESAPFAHPQGTEVAAGRVEQRDYYVGVEDKEVDTQVRDVDPLAQLYTLLVITSKTWK